MLFHVTSREKGMKIWNEGSINIDETINQGRKARRKMRTKIDKLGSQKYEDWVHREEAIFAWTTFEKAVQYSNHYVEPAIVEFEAEDPRWCVENYAIEDLLRQDETTGEGAERIVDMSCRWDGDRSGDIEVWMKPESVTQIYRVTDDFGDPLQ